MENNFIPSEGIIINTKLIINSKDKNSPAPVDNADDNFALNKYKTHGKHNVIINITKAAVPADFEKI